MKMQVNNPEEVVKEAFWLAWKACPEPMGMGLLQNNPDATKGAVWNNILCRGDYVPSPATPGKAYADYVFGRMMKIGFEWDKESITFRDGPLRGDYQSWCGTYNTTADLLSAAVANLRGNVATRSTP